MVGIFKQKAPGNVALLFVLGLLLKLPLFLAPKHAVVSGADGRLYTELALFLKEQNALLTSVLSLLLLYVHALMITTAVNEYRMTAKHTFLPGMAFMLITSLVPQWSFLSAPLVATTFIIWAFNRVFALYNASLAGGRVFNIGLIAGLASFFYFPALALFICLLIGLVILRPFRINEILLLIIGMCTPYYFYAAYLFLFDTFRLNILIPGAVTFYIPNLSNSLWIVFSTIFIGLPFLFGGYYIQVHLRKMLIQARKNWSIVLFFLLLALVIPFINGSDRLTPWVIAAAPFAAFHASAYLYGRTWATNVLFFAMSAFILIQQFVTNAWQ